MSRSIITIDKIAQPIGPFSAAVTGTPGLFLSGRIAQDPETGTLISADAAGQARQILADIAEVLTAAGRTQADVLRMGLYLTDMADFAAVNAVYGEFFQPPYPARTAIAVAGLPLGALVEIDAILA
jgi:2-iminobutanoate/2-iminopropanoate deaminase